MKARQALEQDTRSNRFKAGNWSDLVYPKVLLVYYPQKILSIPRKTSQSLTRRIKNVGLSVSQM